MTSMGAWEVAAVLPLIGGGPLLGGEMPGVAVMAGFGWLRAYT